MERLQDAEEFLDFYIHIFNQSQGYELPGLKNKQNRNF